MTKWSVIVIVAILTASCRTTRTAVAETSVQSEAMSFANEKDSMVCNLEAYLDSPEITVVDQRLPQRTVTVRAKRAVIAAVAERTAQSVRTDTVRVAQATVSSEETVGLESNPLVYIIMSLLFLNILMFCIKR